jgi:hypothetical protein
MIDLDSLFEHWLRVLRSHGELSRPLYETVLEVIETPVVTLTAQIWPEEPLRIELSRRFVDEISGFNSRRQDLIVRSCLYGIEYDPSNAGTADWIVEVVNELLLSFVILHEISHVLCGHVDERVASSGAAKLAFEEHTLNVESGVDQVCDSSGSPVQAVRESYYMELEADNCALQCLSQLPLPMMSIELLSSFEDENEAIESTSIDECGGVGKVVGYRLLLVVAWQIIQLMEARRGPDLRKRFADHPYPGARLLAAISTLLEGFASLAVDKAGDRTLTLDESTSSDMKLFNEEVLKPVLKQDWPVRDESDAFSGVETFPLWVAKETLNLLNQETPETDSGRELEELNSVRRQMLERMSRYRYYQIGDE